MANALGTETFRTKDGRIARGIRTREAILAAYEELIADADLPPTGAELAERAGVSARSVFTHFGDMEGVLAASARRAFDWVVSTHVDIPPNLSLDERIGRFVARHAVVLERTMPLSRMFRGFRHGARRDESPDVREILRGTDRIRRRYTEFIFRWELDAFPELARSEVLSALIVACSWHSWEALRLAQDLEPAGAQAVVRRTFEALLR